jgi:hypothetical protein
VAIGHPFGGVAVGATTGPDANCDAAAIAELQRRFSALPPSAVLQRDELLLHVARCRYREGRWREFFGLARYRRAFEPATEAAERLALLDVLASLRHCRVDRAKDVFRRAPESGAPALATDRRRIGLALEALPGTLSTPPKLDERSPLARGIVERPMHWPVSLEDDRVRRADPFRFQVSVASRCQASAAASAPVPAAESASPEERK